MFPRFLLPLPAFSNKMRKAERPTSHDSTSGLRIDATSRQVSLQDDLSCIRCATCAAHICLTSQIISKGFTGRHGRAYLVSAEPTVTTSSHPGQSLANTLLDEPEPRHLVTGDHTVSDMTCAFCGTLLGWKYVSAEEESQRYKVGKFILETRKVTTTAVWDPVSHTGSEETYGALESTYQASKTAYDKIEFDSQDEDECEDLFSGIWSPGLAVRRRNRRPVQNPSSSMSGIAFY